MTLAHPSEISSLERANAYAVPAQNKSLESAYAEIAFKNGDTSPTVLVRCKAGCKNLTRYTIQQEARIPNPGYGTPFFSSKGFSNHVDRMHKRADGESSKTLLKLIPERPENANEVSEPEIGHNPERQEPMSNVKTPEEAFAAMLAAVPESLRQGFAEYVKARAVVVTEDPRAANLRAMGASEAQIKEMLGKLPPPGAESAPAPVKPAAAPIKTFTVPQTVKVGDSFELVLSASVKGDVTLTAKAAGWSKSRISRLVAKKGEPVTQERIDAAAANIVKTADAWSGATKTASTGFK